MARRKASAANDAALKERNQVIDDNTIVYGYLIGKVTKKIRGKLISQEVVSEEGKQVLVAKYEIIEVTENSVTPWMLPGVGGSKHLNLPYFLRDSVKPPEGYEVEWYTEPLKQRKTKGQIEVTVDQGLNNVDQPDDYSDEDIEDTEEEDIEFEEI